MTGKVPDCVVYVDGVRVNDTAPSASTALDPVALDGLRVTWGRETTVDQPDPAILTMTLLDPEGGRAFMADWHVGSLVTVEATGPTWVGSGYGANVLPGGTFDGVGMDGPDYVRNLLPAVSTLTRVTSPTYAGAGALSMPSRRGQAGAFGLLAAPLPDAGTPPGSWDAVPRISAASRLWNLAAAGVCPLYGTMLASLRLVRSPITDPPDDRSILTGQALTFPADKRWHYLSTDIDIQGLGAPDLQGWPYVSVQLFLATWATPRGLGSMTWQDVDPAHSWDMLEGGYLDEVSARPNFTPAETSTVLVFAGRVTDMTLALDDERRPVVDVTAADAGAELGNRVIGDVPWLTESLATRAGRILAAAGSDLTLYIDPGLRAIPVSYQDVNAQGTLALLQALADSVDAVLWVGTYPGIGTYLRLEDVSGRAPLFRLNVGADGLVHVVAAGGDRILTLSACDVLAEPVEFVQSVADVVNTMAVGWLDQTLDEDGRPSPTERTSILSDPALVAELGTRRMSVQTLLTNATDAQRIGSQLLGRLAVTDWRVTGLGLDAGLLAPADLGLATRVLDGTARNGMPLLLTDLPGWAPGSGSAALYLEGGTYTYTEGEWLLSLTASAAQATGIGLAWDATGAYRWVDFAPEVSWQDLAGVQPVT